MLFCNKAVRLLITLLIISLNSVLFALASLFVKQKISHFKTQVAQRSAFSLRFDFMKGAKRRNLGFRAWERMRYEEFLSVGQKKITTGLDLNHIWAVVYFLPSTECYYKITLLSSPRYDSWNACLSAASKLPLWPFHVIQGHFVYNPAMAATALHSPSTTDSSFLNINQQNQIKGALWL